MNEPDVVNHGDVFNIGKNWYTWYCPKCGEQVTPTVGIVACKCGCAIDWDNKERGPIGL